MSILMRAESKQRVSTALFYVSTGAFVLAGAITITLSAFGMPVMLWGSQVQWDAIRTSPLVVIPFALFTVIGLFSMGGYNIMKRERKINCVVIEDDLFDHISDVLLARGIKNTRRFIREHPSHIDECHQFYRDNRDMDIHERVYDTAASASLIFTSDKDPELTRLAILNIVQEHELKDAAQIEGLLGSVSAVATPLMDGAL